MVNDCVVCGKSFYAKPNRVAKGAAKTCSLICRGIHQRKRISVVCSRCGKAFERTPSGLLSRNYCSRFCKERDQQIGGPLALPHYKTGEFDYRNRAFRNHGRKCDRCSYEKDERMLDIHHLDGDRKNGLLNNLRVLCVWCHALYTRKVLGE